MPSLAQSLAGGTTDPQTATNTAAVAALTARIDNRDQKDSVRAASLTNLTLSGTQTVDGVALVAGDRVGVLGQTLGQNNGIYTVAAGAWARSADAATSAMVTPGMFFFAEEGTVSRDKAYELTTDAPITLGTTVLTFAVFGGGGAASAITNDSSVVGTTVKDALNTLLAADALKADAALSIRAHTGTADTLVLADAGKLITSNSASAVIETVPANAAVAIAVGSVVSVLQLGAGQVSLAITSDTLLLPPGFVAKTRGQNSLVTLTKIASTTWLASGDLSFV